MRRAEIQKIQGR